MLIICTAYSWAILVFPGMAGINIICSYDGLIINKVVVDTINKGIICIAIRSYCKKQ
jgi:hypothetical protein